MSRPGPTHFSHGMLGAAGILATVTIAVSLRIHDPLSTFVLPMEDSWRHMALTREYLRSSTVLSTETLDHYPPGFHALMAALWVYTGADMYDLFRFGPVIAGAVGTLGIGILLWRHLGPTAAVIGSLAFAVAPGLVLDTTVMRPTTLDLVLTPFLFFAILEIIQGRLRWMAAAIPIVLFVVVSHPWFLGLLVIPMGLFIVFCLAAPAAGTRTKPASLQGIAAVFALFVGAMGLTMTTLGGVTRGLRTLLPSFMGHDWMAWVVIAASLAPLALLLAFPRAGRWFPPSLRRPLLLRTRLAISLMIAGTFTAITLAAHQQGLPAHVDLARDYGWPILTLSAFGLVALPFLSNRIALLAAACVASLYPLSLFDPFGIEWLPYRVSTFLGIGLVMMTGVAVGGLAHWMKHALTALQKPLGTSPAVRLTAWALPVLLVVGPLGGSVYLATPEREHWYRIHGECEVHALEDVAGILNEEPDAVILSGSWQSWLIIAAFVDDTDRTWFGHWWMREYQWHHEKWLERQSDKNAPLYLLIDPYTHDEVDDLEFLGEEPWSLARSWCPGPQGPDPIRLYTSGVPPQGTQQ